MAAIDAARLRVCVKPGRVVLSFVASLAVAACSTTNRQPIEPIAASCADRLSGNSVEIALSVSAEAGRMVPLTLFVPERPGTYPLIGFSHGAFASPTRYRAMLAPLAAAGYIVIAPMHIDSEEFGSTERPTQADTWRTRNLDMALALAPGQNVREALSQRRLAIDPERIASVGHSYGAIIAQLPGGAMAIEPDGSQINRSNPAVDAVVGWSPPGEVPGMISAEGWSSLAKPTLTITGTADVLPGFIEDWRSHMAAYDFSPAGQRAVWVGDGIDHYFGGMFGREKPASESSQLLFRRALAVSLNFIDRAVGRSDACTLGEAVAGESYREDGI